MVGYSVDMTLHFNSTTDTLPGMLRERISQHFVNHPGLRSGGTGSYTVLPHTVDKRALPLAELAYDHFAPKLENGPAALKTSLHAMARSGSSLSKSFRAHIEAHPAEYPIKFYDHVKGENNCHIGYTAERTADRLAAGLCNELENVMIVKNVSAAPVTAITPQARALADQIASKDASRAA